MASERHAARLLRVVTDGARAVAVTTLRSVGRPVVGRTAGRLLARVPAAILTDRKAALLLGRAASGLAAVGNAETARRLVISAGRSRRPAVVQTVHQLLVDMGDLDEAARCAPTDGDIGVVLEADRHLAVADPDSATTALNRATRQDSADVTARRIRLLSASGRFDEVLDVLARTGSGGRPPIAFTIARFDALWALGRADEAEAVLEASGPAGWTNVELLRRRCLVDRTLGRTDDRPITGFLNLHPDDLTLVLFETDRVDELIVFGDRERDRLGPTGRYQLARAHYVRRDFDQARRHSAGLTGTSRHWDGEKLNARMLLEEGRPAEALANRRSSTRFRQVFDEVEYFALLHLGRHDEAFATYLHRDDGQRLDAVFGSSAEVLPSDPVGSRFVIAQNGPGDEVMLAATYSSLAEISAELHITCDPRLVTLLERSFPGIRFHPTERRSSTSGAGFAGPDRPARAHGAYFDLLTADAGAVAASSDRVVMGRSLLQLAPGAVPFAPYLVADATQLGAQRERVPVGAIGLLWRSEFMDAIRSIHYVTARDLAPLANTGNQFVILQHDVSDAERRTVMELFGERVVFLDDLDLRNDFEVAAAVVSCCDVVIGPGTTMVELSAALGVSTITLHSNRIGAWRADLDGRDYWHRSMLTAIADIHTEPGSAVDRAAALLTTLVSREN